VAGVGQGVSDRQLVDAMQAWQTSFDPTSNITARKLVNAWKDRLQQSERTGGLLHARFNLVFNAVLKSHMTPASRSSWTAVQ
jgi:HD-like signal output (HDOD) protein